MKAAFGLCLAGVLIASAARAFEPISLPETAESTYGASDAPASLSLPVGVFDGSLPMREVEGEVRQRAWRIPAPSLSTLSIVQGVRSDLELAGYDTILDCSAQSCGGFDFRFGLPVLPAPSMSVDLFDFRVLTATRSAAGAEELVFVLVSRGRNDRYIQISEVVVSSDAQGVAPGSDPEAAAPPEPSEPVPDIIARLRSAGRVVLRDLEFASGADGLNDRVYPSLEALAAFLKEDPSHVVALVGHTDAVGSLDVNTALSRQRAAAVRQRLISRHGVSGGQVSAHGVGYLAPVAPNRTQTGREANRRVEAVLLGAE